MVDKVRDSYDRGEEQEMNLKEIIKKYCNLPCKKK